jgi:hypothetical protein
VIDWHHDGMAAEITTQLSALALRGQKKKWLNK